MNELPLVSIVVITYNSSKFVIETLESAKAQTYQNIELIISDDCSTDNTVELCREWIERNGSRFVRTELITVEKNTGIAPNCNRALKMAKGEWVKEIAGDDILLSSCISDNINFIKANKEIQILFSAMYMFKDDIPLDLKKLHNPITTPMAFLLPPKEQIDILITTNFIPAPTSFINKTGLEIYGYYDEEYPMWDDYPMWIKLIKNNVKLHFMPKITVLYRQGDTISASTGKIRMNRKYYLSIKKFRKHLMWDSELTYRQRIKVFLLYIKEYFLYYIFFNRNNKITFIFEKMMSKLIMNI